jgi:hypothetical protein
VNRIEDRLRDAFGAAAGTVRPELVARLPEPSRVARTRRLTALTAAAAVAVVIVAASVMTPLALAGGHGAPSRPAGPAAPSPTAPAHPSSTRVTTVPMVVGMTSSQAAVVLQAAGLLVMIDSQGSSAVPPGTVIAQNPDAGSRLTSGATITLTVAASGSSETFTLAPTRLATFPVYAVTIAVEQNWQPTPFLGPAEGYRGADGWVTLSAVAEPSGLEAACSAVAGQPAYGSHPQIIDRSIGGRPGCLIVPSGDAPAAAGGPGLPETSALVEYRTPLSRGDNFLLISTDPPHLQQVVASVQLHH